MISEQSAALHERLEVFEEEHIRLISSPYGGEGTQSSTNVALNGATGALLLHAITELQRCAHMAFQQLRAAAPLAVAIN